MASFNDFFEGVIDNTCTDQAEKTTEITFRQLGLNTTTVKAWHAALRKLIVKLEEGCTELSDLVDNFHESCFNLIRAQPGLRSFPISEKLREIPQNKAFWDLIDKTNEEIRHIRKNPAKAAVHFNLKTAETYARIIISTTQLVIPDSVKLMEP
jgi:hypothetical protein